MTVGPGPVLDPNQIAEMVAMDQGRGAVYAHFVDLFVTSTGDKISRIRDHARAGDLVALADATHTLRGTSGNVGAIRLTGLLKNVEIAARKADLRKVKEFAALLDAEYAETRAAPLAEAK
mgnify:CR=1 FL=1